MRDSALFLLLTGSLLLVGCNDARQAANPHDAVHIHALEEQVVDQQGALAQREATIADLQGQLASASRAPAKPDLSDLDRELSGTGAEVSWRDGELIISIASDILFASGKAELTADAKRSLRQVADTLKRRYSQQFVRVEGHTDNEPIVRTRKLWEDNWHLAGARARAVLHELIERGGLRSQQISFAGYADQRPRASNADRSGRAQNRRVEIVVLPAQRP